MCGACRPVAPSFSVPRCRAISLMSPRTSRRIRRSFPAQRSRGATWSAHERCTRAERSCIWTRTSVTTHRCGADPYRRPRRRRRPTFADRAAVAFEMLATPAPYAVRVIAIGALCIATLAGATLAGADTLPDDPLYSFKLAGEDLRLTFAL